MEVLQCVRSVNVRIKFKPIATTQCSAPAAAQDEETQQTEPEDGRRRSSGRGGGSRRRRRRTIGAALKDDCLRSVTYEQCQI